MASINHFSHWCLLKNQVFAAKTSGMKFSLHGSLQDGSVIVLSVVGCHKIDFLADATMSLQISETSAGSS